MTGLTRMTRPGFNAGWYCQFEQTNGIIKNQYQVRPAEGGGKIGWDGTRGVGTS